jgi:hypothetical protein
MPSLPGDLFDFITIRADLILMREIGAVRFRDHLQLSLTPSGNSQSACLSGEGSFLKFLLKDETISAEISSLVDKHLLSGAMILSMPH